MLSLSFPRKIMRGTDSLLWKEIEMQFAPKSIPNQEFMQPSVDGTLIKCIYQLTVSCIHYACTCCECGPIIINPIPISTPEISDEQIGYTDNCPHIYESHPNDVIETTRTSKKETTYFEVTK